MTADPPEAWVGIDLGTQSVRTLVVDGRGTVLGAAGRKLTSRRDGNRHEQDPQDWWEAVTAATAEAVRDTRRTAPGVTFGGVAVDATSGTVLLVDRRDGTPLTPALMYDDGRAADLVDRVNEAGGAVWRRLGYQRMQRSWGLPKLLWLVAEHPDLVGRARLAHQSDVITERLVGRPVATDLSNALKSGADLVGGVWPSTVLDTLGASETLLPPLARPGERLGTVGAAAATATGLPEGTPVIAGMTDGCAAQLGAGALEVGSWNSVLGTTLVVKGVAAELVTDPTGAVYCHRGPGDTWLPGGASSTGAGAISRDFPDADLDALNRAAAAYEPAGMLTYPLVSSGERFPFVAPEATGFTTGPARDDGERFAAVLQGVAFLERLGFDHLDRIGAPTDGALVLTGGATRSAYWNQLRADVLGRPVTLPDTAEPALGMALLAAAQDRPVTERAADMVHVRTVLDPDPNAGERYGERFADFVTALDERGWLPDGLAAHARDRLRGWSA
ncbi:carbohydrate kinase [Nakamurella flava]|uniref:Carbohydrate kinase n=1 Tax=Nakamurella flava TaxID=2576308 RepID=A0A4U6QBE2_9ACTN|nr:FGGY family carbohydrate kinase [Nakamurella flava]TKV57377.1 carbohydrate kinase [Nakamurella flava]